MRYCRGKGNEPAEGLFSSECIKRGRFFKGQKAGPLDHYRLDEADFLEGPCFCLSSKGYRKKPWQRTVKGSKNFFRQAVQG